MSQVKDHYSTHPFSSPLKYGLGREFVLEFIPDEGMVLDVGCGSGRTLRLMGNRRPEVERYAMDINPRAVGHLNSEVPAIVADALEIPFSDETFDGVYSIGVLHHTPDPMGGLDECVRVLKPGGFLVVALYNYYNSYRKIYEYGSKIPGWIQDRVSHPLVQDQLFTPIAHFYKPERIERELSERGITPLDWRGTGIYPPFTGRKASFMYYGGVKS